MGGWVGGGDSYLSIDPHAFEAFRYDSTHHGTAGGNSGNVVDVLERVGGWVGGWVGLVGRYEDRGERGASNELLYVSYGWVGGWVGD